MNTITVLRYGTQVRLEHLDKYGYCGRDNHPEEHDVGFVGIVIANVVCDFGKVRMNVLGGTEIVATDEEWPDVCYVVQGADGRILDLMEHEIEVLA